MKTFGKLLFIGSLASLAALTSCDKKGDPAPDRAELLMGKKWSVTASTMTYTDGQETHTEDIYAEMEACEKDDLMEFKANSVLTHSEGTTKCDEEDEDSYDETWSLSADHSKLIIETDEETLVFDIQELNDSKLTIKTDYGTGSLVSTVSFVKK
ncbi:Lipocalin-like domain-containing protein [Catalinimonas alkaloidigena]|uniref:Lipocalin-like domain-containing protein n=1 Tax=Catalinimonas alkaloidigena TaxID=1075417 RepID=A0A1G9BGG0_9BACT|nr:lipocalin family protein [Catalinimonas alkaloidigena]SDK38602.1 Lipocalin-like domain-containing protein [Catalinimonas alkaloidigena]